MARGGGTAPRLRFERAPGFPYPPAISSDPRAEMSRPPCPICRAPVPQQGRGRPKKYCSAACRTQARSRQAYQREMEAAARWWASQGDGKQAARVRAHARSWLARWDRDHLRSLRASDD